jgi:hypothetical protein
MIRYLWGFEPEGNVEHIAEHGLTTEDWEYAFENHYDEQVGRSSGRLVRFAFLGSRRYMVSFDWIDETTVLPITGYEVE